MPIVTIKNIKTTSLMFNEIIMGWSILVGYVWFILVFRNPNVTLNSKLRWQKEDKRWSSSKYQNGWIISKSFKHCFVSKCRFLLFHWIRDNCDNVLTNCLQMHH
jgi:hypothetical protein